MPVLKMAASARAFQRWYLVACPLHAYTHVYTHMHTYICVVFVLIKTALEMLGRGDAEALPIRTQAVVLLIDTPARMSARMSMFVSTRTFTHMCVHVRTHGHTHV